MLRIALRRPYQLVRCSTDLTRPVVNDELDLTPEIEQAKSIRELREIKSRLESPNSDPSQEEERYFLKLKNIYFSMSKLKKINLSDMEILGYIHMKDERLAFVDPERENYVVSRLKPGKLLGFISIQTLLLMTKTNQNWKDIEDFVHQVPLKNLKVHFKVLG